MDAATVQTLDAHLELPRRPPLITACTRRTPTGGESFQAARAGHDDAGSVGLSWLGDLRVTLLAFVLLRQFLECHGGADRLEVIERDILRRPTPVDAEGPHKLAGLIEYSTTMSSRSSPARSRRPDRPLAARRALAHSSRQVACLLPRLSVIESSSSGPVSPAACSGRRHPDGARPRCPAVARFSQIRRHAAAAPLGAEPGCL
jgi:hypothetical protein